MKKKNNNLQLLIIKKNNLMKALIILCMIFNILLIIMFIMSLINLDSVGIVLSITFLFIINSYYLTSPYIQNSKDFNIKLKNKNSIKGFKLYYKNKEVYFPHEIIDNKLSFIYQDMSPSYLEYKDKSKMKSIEQEKIYNYFIKWLKENNYFKEI